VTVEGDSPGGAKVTFAVTATDLVDGDVPVTCTPASGSQFGIGTTIVTCRATDTHQNTGTTTVPVTVRDTTPPALALPGDIAAEATSPAGAPVTFSASAVDLVDGSVPAACSPTSGDSFPMGTTTVHCTATDSHGNTAAGSFAVTVRDTTAPVISWTGNLGTYAIDTTVAITCSATDSGSGIASTTCRNISGPASSFQPGLNTFTATATDNAGNSSSASTSFTVVVTADSLCALTQQYVTKPGVADSLCAKLRTGAAAAARGDHDGANTALRNYQNEVSAQSGKSLAADRAAALNRLAQALAASWS
jgi:hypothetical protein